MFNDLVLAMQSKSQSVATFYEFSVLFINCYTCLQEYNAVRNSFAILSSTLKAYLDKLWFSLIINADNVFYRQSIQLLKKLTHWFFIFCTHSALFCLTLTSAVLACKKVSKFFAKDWSIIDSFCCCCCLECLNEQ